MARPVISDVITLREFLELEIEQIRALILSNDVVRLREFQQFQELYRAAHTSLQERVEAVDAARDAMDKERSLYISRDFLDSRLGDIQGRLAEMERSRANIEGRFWMFGAGLTGLSVLIQLFLHYAVGK